MLNAIKRLLQLLRATVLDHLSIDMKKSSGHRDHANSIEKEEFPDRASRFIGTSTFDNAQCEACGYGSTTSFNYNYAKRHADSDYALALTFLNFCRDLRFGQLYKCIKCEKSWFLDDKHVMHAIPLECLQLLEEWNSKKILLSPKILDDLMKIGACPPDIYGNGAKYIAVPCKVTCQDGTVFDPAIISFQKHPPLESWRMPVRLANTIEKVEPSQWTLPKEVRYATTQAEEASMGFAPTLVKAPDGAEFILNWTTDFFFSEKYAAKDICLSISVQKRKIRPPIANYDGYKISYFVADRDPNVEHLVIQQPMGSHQKSRSI